MSGQLSKYRLAAALAAGALRRGNAYSGLARADDAPAAAVSLGARVKEITLQPVAVVGHKALRLAPGDGLIQLAVHLPINHQFGQPFARGLLDVALLARAQPIDWSTLVARARAWRVGTVVRTVLRLTADLLGLEEVKPAIIALTPSLLRRELLSLFVSQESLLTMRDLRRGPSRFGLQLLLVDRARCHPVGVASAVA